MIDPVVRPAGAADVPELTALEAEARATLVDQRGGARWLEEHPPHGPGWDTPGAWTVVATLDDVVVGYLVLDVGQRIARVESVYVTAAARELGFGDALLDAALAEARRRGATHLEAEALPGDRDTKNLYERAGITARLITVSTPLA